jgi:hypothetical protein
MNDQPSIKSYSAFTPIVLISSGVILLYSWNLMITLKQQAAAMRISAQQDVQLAQVVQTEQKLRTMMTDLLDLAKTDKDAEGIIKRYKIAIHKDK